MTIDLEAALRALHAGELVAFPTETVYGLGADATNDAAVQRIFAVKGRPHDHPLIVHVGSPAGLAAVARDPVPDVARTLAERFWPGPLTIIVGASKQVSRYVTGGRDTIAVRVPDHPVALALLGAFGRPIAAPSANRFGKVSATTADDVRTELGDEVAVVLDGGPCRIGIESTIVDVTVEPIVILRPGAVTADEIETTLGRAVEREASGPSRAPGMLASHYAPRARVEVLERAAVGERVAQLRRRGMRVAVIDPHVSVEEYARSLYGWLHAADRDGAEYIVIVPPPDEGLGHAVRDRLRKAAGGGHAETVI